MKRRPLEVEVLNHQAQVAIPECWLKLLTAAVLEVRPEIDALAAAGSVWPELAAVEAALLDDARIGGVHGQFMGDPAPTDVITFEHGEIVIGVETAVRQAAEHGEPVARELLRYLIHGLLHLAGYDDRHDEDRARMIREQERLLADVWPRLAAAHDLLGS
jgi:probable rRNA maturation factor